MCIRDRSYDGYPIYGPWGYNSSGAVAREVSGYRLRTTLELAGARPDVTTAGTTTYAVTVAGGKFLFGGTTPAFLDLDRGKTYVFQQNDSSNDGEQLLISATENGWHSTGSSSDIGNTTYLYTGNGIKYYLEGSEVTYASYLSGYNGSTAREIRFTVPVDSPAALYLFGYTTTNLGIRTVQDGYLLGDLTSDYIWDNSPLWLSSEAYAIYETVKNSSDVIYEATAAINSGGSQPTHTSGTTSNWKYIGVKGTLDAYNGKFGVTPESVSYTHLTLPTKA